MKLQRLLKRFSQHADPAAGGLLPLLEAPLFCPRLTVTSLEVKGKGQIFIGTFSPELCGAEQSVSVDVMCLRVYLAWQSPQVRWVLLSIGAGIFLVTFSNVQTHSVSASR